MGSDWVQVLDNEPQQYPDGLIELDDGTVIDLNAPSPWLEPLPDEEEAPETGS